MIMTLTIITNSILRPILRDKAGPSEATARGHDVSTRRGEGLSHDPAETTAVGCYQCNPAGQVDCGRGVEPHGAPLDKP